MTNRIDLQVRVRHTVGKGRFGIQPIQAQQLHITESSKKINLKLNSRYLTTSARLKDDSRPFFLSDSFQSVVHYYVSVDGMRQQEGPLKIMKSIKYRTDSDRLGVRYLAKIIQALGIWTIRRVPK